MACYQASTKGRSKLDAKCGDRWNSVYGRYLPVRSNCLHTCGREDSAWGTAKSF